MESESRHKRKKPRKYPDRTKPREPKPRGFQMPEVKEGDATVTAIKAQQKRADRCNIFLDDKYWAPSPIQVILDEDLKVGKVLDPESQQKLAETIARRDACQKSLDILAQRNVSSGQLLQALKRRNYPEDAILAAEQFIAERELIDDAYWAEASVRDSIRMQRSKRQAEQRLQKAGVEEDLREAALEQYDEQSEEEIVRALVEKSSVDPKKTRERLMRKGFAWDVVSSALAELMPDNPEKEDDEREPGERNKPAVDLDRLRRDVRKRYARASDDFAVKRKALAWLGRRGIYGDQAHELLQDDED